MFSSKLSLCRQMFRLGKRLKINNYVAATSNYSNVLDFDRNLVRFKYSSVANKGVKGSGRRKYPQSESAENQDVEDESETSDEKQSLFDDNDYDLIANQSMHIVSKKIMSDQNVLVIQPYIKWGPKKSTIKPELLLQEAESLIRTLPNWNIEYSIKVPVENLDRKIIFGSGKMEEIKEMIAKVISRGKVITCIFVSKSVLTYMQKYNLEDYFNIPVMDRYSVVVQILRLHATTMEAKLQVAMAEIPYIWGQMRDLEMLGGIQPKKQKFFLTDSQRLTLKQRERKIKYELQQVRQHRELLRNKRKQKNYPIIAVVGYTNAGKTSLIKALTQGEKLQPRNQLFATLDVTAHSGFLPSKLEVLYMDSVGFMMDLPTGLIECFVATLEDALGADLILHVTDLSHESFMEQKNHVEQTLASLIRDNTSQTTHILGNLITIGNKVDLVNQNTEIPEDIHKISSTTLEGVRELMEIVEKKLLEVTGRVKITIRIPNGGEEMQWLYKNSAVTDSEADPEDSQKILLHIVISNAKLQQFKHHFLKPT